MTNSLSNFKFSTLVEILRKRALYQPNKLAFIFLVDGETESSSLTYQELDRLSRAVAAQLQSLGIPKGGRALLMYPPGLEFIAAFFGCLYSGVVAVPAYPPHSIRSMPRLQSILTDAQATVALTTTQILSSGSRWFNHASELKTIQWLTTDNLIHSVENNWQETTVTSDTLAFLQYTSGSTGTPKGVMVSHGNLLHNERLIQKAFEHTEQSIVVGWLPLFHDMGLIGNVLQPLYLGITCILMPPIAFLQSPVRWLQAISLYKATTSGGPNFAYDLCVNKITPEQRATLDLSSWKVAFNGAEPVRAETIERFTRTFADCGFSAQAFYPCYGMAETTLIVSGGLITNLPVFQNVKKTALLKNQVVPTTQENGEAQTLVGCGQPLENLQLVIADPETLTSCSPEKVGEIWVSGLSVASGYWNQIEQTKHTFCAYLKDTGEGPFLRTGDLGFLYSGELFITGRLKDLIIIRGRNHYPQDIELTVEQSHPALQVGCSAAFSIDVVNEERLVVVQEVKRSYLRNLNVNEVIGAIRQTVAENYQLQVYGVLLLKPGSIPKTSSGKIQRHICRLHFLNKNPNIVASSILEEPYSVESEQTLTREALLAIELESRQQLLKSYLQKQVAQQLKIAPSQIDPQQPLTTLGLDSLNAVELKNSLETNLTVVLSMTNFLQGSSIAELVSEVLTQLTAPVSILKNTVTPTLNAGAEHFLSYGQQALWFLHQLAPESSAYNIASAALLRGNLDVLTLQRTFQRLVDRHSSLRTTFTALNGKPVQHVHKHMEVCFQKEDVSNWSESFLNNRLVEETHQPFNLEQGPLLRVKLFSRSAQEHILLLAVHHIVTDLWSLAILVQELGILYQSEKDGTPVSLAPLPLEYTDYTRWQTEMLMSKEGERLWRYWQKQLASELPVLNLPTDRSRPPIQTYCGATVPFRFSGDITQRLKVFSRAHRVTLYMTMLAAFQVLLYRYTGQEDILVGSPTAGRSQSDLMGLVGYFVNPVVVRVNFSGNPTFKMFLGQVRSAVLNAFEHQDYPFALLVERLQPVRDPSQSPLVQTMFVLQKAPKLNEEGLTAFVLGEAGTQMRLGGLEMESLALEQRLTQFDLTLMMSEVEEGIAASFEYNTDLFNAATIIRMARHFQTIVEGILAYPERRLSDLPLLTQDERQNLLQEWNSTQTDYLKDICVYHLFEAQVEQFPDAIAVVFESQQLTYQELNNRANQLAHYLRRLGVKPDIPVGICVERSLEMIVGLLGILKAGGAYLPLDPTYPKERLAFMVEDSQPPVLLTQNHLVAKLPLAKTQVICLDTDWEVIADNSDENLLTTVLNENLAYVIYTSGSTGQPKGVLISHQAIANHCCMIQKYYELDCKDRVLQFATFNFDVSLEQILPTLICGATLVVRDINLWGTTEFHQKLLDYGITVADLPTGYWQQLVQEWVKTPELIVNQQLRLLSVGGDVMLPEVLNLWQQKSIPSTRLVNAYGPTETTITVTIFEIPHRVLSDTEYQRIPIGRALANKSVYILDSHNNLVPIGVPGELHIGGVGLARGYLNRVELTAEKFIPNPWSQEEGGRLYKTGDLARYLPDGNIEFLGRIDHQVKIRGFRIELGEIEAVLRQHPGVRETVVLVREDIPGVQPLVAYIVISQESAPNITELGRFLKQRLPEYMIPTSFMILDTLPKLLNGKVNRKALSAIKVLRSELELAYVAPQSEVERTIAMIWQEVLHLDQVGVNDNFFELGGHSLLIVQVHNKIRKTFKTDISIVDMFKYPTIISLVNYLRLKETDKTFSKETNKWIKELKDGRNRLSRQFKQRERR